MTPGDTGNAGRDPLGDLLTSALKGRADQVRTDPGALQEIRRRTARRTRRFLTYAAAATTAAAVVVAVAVAASGPGRTPQAADDTTSPTAPASGRLLPVWYPGGDSAARRLYVERHLVDVSGDDVAVPTVREYLTRAPFDPDYLIGWPSGLDVREVSTRAGVTTVRLAGHSLEGPVDEAAVQALLRNAGVRPGRSARIELNGAPLPLPFGVDQPVTAAPDDAVRAWISIDDLADGDVVEPPVTVTVSGNVFEGNVNWELLRDGGPPVRQGYVSTAMGSWESAEIHLRRLAPGRYTLVCFEVDAETGDRRNADDKTFSVR